MEWRFWALVIVGGACGWAAAITALIGFISLVSAL